MESVVIEENCIQILIEELGWNWTLELIESEIQELEGGHGQHHIGEAPHEAVVTDVQLVEELHALQRAGNNAAEAVGVDMEESQVGEEAQLRGQITGDIRMVEVDASNHFEGGIGERRGTIHTHVGADLGTNPVGGEVEGV